MRISFTEEHNHLRAQLRDYFAELMTDDRKAALAGDGGEYGDGTAYKEIVRQLGRDGWLAIGWPLAYGGQQRPMLDQLIFTDEAAIAGVPVPFLTINTVGPTIMRYGTDAQKEYYLPRIARGELHFAIGYSEPEAGTDLAGLRTRAERDGDSYVINGQKMWTSLIEYADYVWLAARTDPEATKHKGLSILIVPTDAPGFSWTKVRTVAGPGTSATYYSDVRVPVSQRVGEEHRGWPLITNQLNHERVALTSAAPLRESLRQVREWAQQTKQPSGGTPANQGVAGGGGARVIDAEWVRLHLARVHAHADCLKLRNWRIAGAEGTGDLAPAEASATKVFGTEFATEGYRLVMEVLGAGAVVRSDSPGALLRGRIERLHRSSLILTFGGGTNEVQRDIIAATALGLHHSTAQQGLERLERLLGWSVRTVPGGVARHVGYTGSNGVVVCGTTGESPPYSSGVLGTVSAPTLANFSRTSA
jgi:alkylation response protein AidB-like acyl-CoA dehydrogenase